MNIGIKYCGGCNAIYNRSRQVNLLKEKFPEHVFRTLTDGNENDIWLVVCGCSRVCASTDDLKANKKMFVLSSERSFDAVRDYLADNEMKKTVARVEQKGYDTASKVLRVGQEAEVTKTFFQDDVKMFAALTGDHSRLHTDAEFAKKSPYGKTVVHGALVASLLSTAMGMKLPGEGTVFIEEEVRFLKPVYHGDTITAKIRLISCREGITQYVGNLSGICVNQNGEVVVEAECRQFMTKELFYIVNPHDKAEPLF